MKVAKSLVRPIVAATFPAYDGRKFYVEVCETTNIYNLNWCEGTRNQYRAYRISDGRVESPGLEHNAPWKQPAEGATVQVPPGILVVCHSHFCGRDCGITIYANPADVGALKLPAPNAAAALIA